MDGRSAAIALGIYRLLADLANDTALNGVQIRIDSESRDLKEHSEYYKEFWEKDKAVDDALDALDSARIARQQYIRDMRAEGWRIIDIADILDLTEQYVQRQVKGNDRYVGGAYRKHGKKADGTDYQPNKRRSGTDRRGMMRITPLFPPEHPDSPYYDPSLNAHQLAWKIKKALQAEAEAQDNES